MSTPRGIGEQWLPIPERLVRDIETAPTAARRLIAVVALALWAVAFSRARRGESCSVRDLSAWTGNKRNAPRPVGPQVRPPGLG